MLTPTVNDNPSLERIEMLLLELGVQPNLDGFVYLARTIQYYCTGKFKQISPIAEIVAAEYNTTSFSIKRMMPYVIQNADNMLKRIVQKTGVPISKTNLTLLSFVVNISMIVKYMPDSRADEFEKRLAAKAAAAANATAVG
jgi:hypothetical protein